MRLLLALLVFSEMRLPHVIPNGGEKSKKYIIETTGSGVALFDYDNDGLTDIFIVSGEGAPSRMYHNLGSLKFEEVGAKLGLTRTGWGQGACAADIDGDGFTDLFVTYWGSSVLYRNAGGKRFEAVAFPKHSGYATGCVFFDYDRDGDLDLYVSNYLHFDFATTPLPGANPYCFYRGMAVNCGPRGLPFERNSLYRNDGKGRFTDVSEASGIAAPEGHYSLGAIATDVDQDGWPDLYVACDQTPSLLYMNQRDGTFKEEGLLRGVALDENGKALSGMGVAAADYDNDGAIDLFRTNFSDERVTLYRNRKDGSFDEMTTAAGLGINTKYVGWGTAFLDFDNDGRVDLIQVNGHVFPEAGNYKQRAILYRNTGTKFVEVPGPSELHSARGLAVGDLDNDGTLEVVINNQNEAPSIWHLGEKPSGNWVEFDLPVGTTVRIKAGGVQQMNEVRAGGSYLSQHDRRLHFGLGSSPMIEEVVITSPKGEKRILKNQPVNRIVR